MTVRVQAIGGLANRLRVALSYLAAYESQGIEIVWVPDGEIANARFLDVFQPIDGITFLDEGRGDELKSLNPLAGAWAHKYSLLVPVEKIRDRISILKIGRGPYAAMHIRRTDLPKEWFASNEKDEDFVAWAKAQPMQVYVATDNGTTQRALVDWLGAHCFFNRPISVHDRQDDAGQRNTMLSDAVVDLFMCGGSKAFKGCVGSSFSTAVTHLRDNDGWWKR